MSAQRHIVQRQVLELTIPKQAQARQYQDELSRIYRERIIPMLDRYCSDLSGPEERYRIESLQLELGALPADDFEEQFVRRVETALKHELTRQISDQAKAARQSSGSPQADAQLELFAFFLRTGSLPWWADSSSPGLLAENLARLLTLAPQALRELLRQLLREPNARQRLINQYSDEQLAALLGVLLPAHRAVFTRDLPALANLLKTAGQSLGGPARASRQIFWRNLLVIANNGTAHPHLENFYRLVFRALLEIPGSETLPLHLAETASAAGNRELATLLGKIVPATAPASVIVSVQERLLRRLEELRSLGGLLASTWAKLRAWLTSRQLPGALQATLLAALNSAPQRETSLIPLNLSEILAAIQQIAQDTSPQSPNSTAILNEILAELESVLASQPDEHPTRENRHDAEEYPVANAGLVILWPFLGHFFSHLGLLDEDRRSFLSFEMRQRAVGLLQVVAAKDAASPEYLLPLNKLLCGLPPETPLDLGQPLREEEIAECENLLEAVIAQAPILREMQPDGLRGSFLLRPGLLGMQDNAWLLRVERQTYDIVLERFPWNWEWVKLPWMETPLRVEW